LALAGEAGNGLSLPEMDTSFLEPLEDWLIQEPPSFWSSSLCCFSTAFLVAYQNKDTS